jgi:ketosteroid isomerase-like protein
VSVVDHDKAEQLAREWLHAWNSHDARAVVEHFAEDVVVSSPLIDARRPGSGGRLHGRNEVLAYYEEGLVLAPDLHFDLRDVPRGVDQVTIVSATSVRV